MKTTEYLAAVRRKMGLSRSAEVARLLELSEAAVSRYESGARVMDDYTAARVAEVLGIDPLTVIAQANAEREKDGEKRQFWERLAHAAVVVLTFGSLFISAAPEAQAMTTTYDKAEPRNTNYRVFRGAIRRVRATVKRLLRGLASSLVEDRSFWDCRAVQGIA